MVIDDFDINSVAFGELKAHPPLVVDTNAPLAFPITFQRFKTIRSRLSQVLNFGCGIELCEAHRRAGANLRRETPRSAGSVELLGLAVRERYNHTIYRKLFVYSGKAIASRWLCRLTQSSAAAGARSAEGDLQAQLVGGRLERRVMPLQGPLYASTEASSPPKTLLPDKDSPHQTHQ